MRVRMALRSVLAAAPLFVGACTDDAPPDADARGSGTETGGSGAGGTTVATLPTTTDAGKTSGSTGDSGPAGTTAGTAVAASTGDDDDDASSTSAGRDATSTGAGTGSSTGDPGGSTTGDPGTTTGDPGGSTTGDLGGSTTGDLGTSTTAGRGGSTTGEQGGSTTGELGGSTTDGGTTGTTGDLGDCCAEHPTPGCNVPSCEGQVCAEHPYCCAVDWHPVCAAEAMKQPTCPCGPATGGPDGTGNCCVPNGSPRCEDLTCEELICELDPECCHDDWTPACAALALAEPICNCDGINPDQDCCAPSPDGTPGCSDPTCVDSICALDPSCCDEEWDAVCAAAADGSDGGGNACDICGFNCGHPLCVTNGSLTCELTNDCVGIICAHDPFCCSSGFWDAVCVEHVADECELTCPA